MSNIKAAITAVGHFVPETVLSNQDLEKIVNTNNDWIVSRTGIKERRVISNGEPTSYLAIKAAEKLFENKGISPDEIELIIVATVTPDMLFPSTVCVVQEKIGANHAWGFDILAACCGFLFSLETGIRFIESGRYKKVLVIGADKMSSITNYKDRNTCVLFGDGAGCVLLEPAEDPDYSALDSIMHIDGRGAKYLHMLGGGSLNPSSHETVDKEWHYIYQEGKTVFRDAVKGMADVSAEIMEKNNLKAEDVAYLVPHQANLRIISACADRMGIGMEKVAVNIDRYGNTTSGTIPICISELWEGKKIKRGDYLILSSFGAGYTWGSILIKWAY